MAVQTEKRGFSGSLRWKHTEEGDHFALYSPLGAQVADIQSNGDGVPPGHQHSLGYQWFGQTAGIDLYRQRSAAAFRDLGSLDAGGAPMREQDRATLWLSVPRGSLSLTWLRYRDAQDMASRTFSVGFTQSFRYANLSANAFDDEEIVVKNA